MIQKYIVPLTFVGISFTEGQRFNPRAPNQYQRTSYNVNSPTRGYFNAGLDTQIPTNYYAGA